MPAFGWQQTVLLESIQLIKNKSSAPYGIVWSVSSALGFHMKKQWTGSRTSTWVKKERLQDSDIRQGVTCVGLVRICFQEDCTLFSQDGNWNV